MTRSLAEIENYLHAKIPLTRAMAVRVESFDSAQLILTAPLEPNHNHLGTAFGGSLSALATLAGYCLIWLALDDASAHVLIRDSTIRFRKPVLGPLRATCRLPSPEILAPFKSEFATHGKARISLAVSIVEDHEPAVDFLGTFVAISTRKI